MALETWKTYHRTTRTGTYSFLVALPLLVLYEVMIFLTNGGRAMQVRVGAEVWIKQLLASIGATGSLVLAGLVVLVGVAVLFYERRKHLPIRPRYFLGMVGESALYAVVVAFLVANAVGMLVACAPAYVGPAAVQGIESEGLGVRLALSIGAGLYEELVFRVILVGGLFWLLKRVLAGRTAAYVIAAIIGALIFSGVHYVGVLGDAFTLPSFTFRFLFGLVLNVLYLVRGFGVAAWTHALYDIMIVTHLLG